MRMLSAFGEVWGFDLAWGGFRFAREYGQRRLARASVTEIPFKSGHFDLVTAFDILACLHEPEEARALAEITRVLRPGGAFVLNTAALPFLHGQHAVFVREVRRATRPRLRASLERAGFEVLRITYTNFTLFPLVAPVRIGQRLIGLSTPEETGTDIALPPAPLNTLLTTLVTAEAAALRRFNMPIGSSLLALARTRT
jgi:SAM-dependent methyltransferase